MRSIETLLNNRLVLQLCIASDRQKNQMSSVTSQID